MKIRAGQIIAFTTGEYSDYGLREHMKAAKSFDTLEEVARFKESPNYLAIREYDKSGQPSEYGSDDRFIAWAIREGLIEPLDTEAVVEWWIGAYGKLESY